MNQSYSLRDAVREAYSAVAERPEDEHPIPVGRRLAENLGYPRELLESMPSVSADAFAGVSNVSVFADIPPGVTVLDLGCGAGLDSLVASRRVGPNGRVIGVDFSDSMLARARRGAKELKANNVDFCRSDSESLPLENGSIDVVLVNGIFNLNTDREAIFQELARVVRPGGAVYAAEIILRESLSEEVKKNEINWFA